MAEEEQTEHWTKRLPRGLRHAGAALTDQAQGTNFRQEMIAREEAAKERNQKRIEKQADREFATAERKASQAHITEQSQLGRDQQTSEREGSQVFAAGESSVDRDWRTEQAALSQEHDLNLVKENSVVQRMLLDAGHAFQASQSKLTREQQTALQEARLTWQSMESEEGRVFSNEQRELGEVFVAGESQLGRAQAALLAQKQMAHSAAEAAKNRTSTADLQGERIGASEKSQTSGQAFQAAQAQLDRDESAKVREDEKRKLATDNAKHSYTMQAQALTKELEGYISNQGSITMPALQALANKEALLRQQIAGSGLSPSEKDALNAQLAQNSGFFSSAVSTGKLSETFNDTDAYKAFSKLSPRDQRNAGNHLQWGPRLKAGNERVQKILNFTFGNGGLNFDDSVTIGDVQKAFDTGGISSFEELAARQPELAADVERMNMAVATDQSAQGIFAAGALETARANEHSLFWSLPDEVTELIPDWSADLDATFSPDDDKFWRKSDGTWSHSAISNNLALRNRQGDILSGKITEMGEEGLWDLAAHNEVIDAAFPNQGIGQQLTSLLNERLKTASPEQLDAMLTNNQEKPVQIATDLVNDYVDTVRRAKRGDYEAPLRAAELQTLATPIEEVMGRNLAPAFFDRLLSFETRDEQVAWLSDWSIFRDAGNSEAGEFFMDILVENTDGSVSTTRYKGDHRHFDVSPNRLKKRLSDAIDNYDIPPFMAQANALRAEFKGQWDQQRELTLLNTQLNESKQKLQDARAHGVTSLIKNIEEGQAEIQLRIDARKEGYHNNFRNLVSTSLLQGEPDEFAAFATDALRDALGISTEATLPAGIAQLESLSEDATSLEKLTALRQALINNSAALGQKGDVKAGARSSILRDAADDFIFLYGQLEKADLDNHLFDILDLETDNDRDKRIEVLINLLTY